MKPLNTWSILLVSLFSLIFFLKFNGSAATFPRKYSIHHYQSPFYRHHHGWRRHSSCKFGFSSRFHHFRHHYQPDVYPVPNSCNLMSDPQSYQKCVYKVLLFNNEMCYKNADCPADQVCCRCSASSSGLGACYPPTEPITKPPSATTPPATTTTTAKKTTTAKATTPTTPAPATPRTTTVKLTTMSTTARTTPTTTSTTTTTTPTTTSTTTTTTTTTPAPLTTTDEGVNFWPELPEAQ